MYPGHWSKCALLSLVALCGCLLNSGNIFGQQSDRVAEELLRRMDRLENENQRRNDEIAILKSHGMPPAPAVVDSAEVFPLMSEFAEDAPSPAGIQTVECQETVGAQPCAWDKIAASLTGKGSDAESKYPVVKVTGFFQADAIWASQTQENRDALVNGFRLDDAQDGADFRRTRLAATGDVWNNVGYMIEMDFAFPGRPSFMDVFADIRDLPFGHFRVGQWRQPFGMDAMTSVRELLFFERALPFAFVPFRQIGAGVYDSNPDLGLTWANSLFRYPTDPFGNNVGDNGGYGYAGRLTWLAIDGDNNQTLHLGGDYSYADPANDFLRYLNQPELFVGETAGALAPIGVPSNLPPFVDTGLFRANRYSLSGLELAGTYDSFFAQSEVYVNDVSRPDAASVTFWGAYAEVAYVLTGEHHPYNKANGVYTRVVPDHPFGPDSGWGAWEIAGRWSTIDLTDQDILGNELTNYTAGLNWYLNKYTKFQFNYIRPILDSAQAGTTSHADFYALRCQLDF